MHQIKKDILDIKKGELSSENIEILQLDQQNLSLVALCPGPLDSPYQGYWFRIKFQWTSRYPFSSPKCRFLDKVWHPYVYFDTGEICLDVLSDNCSSALRVRTYLLSIISALSDYKIQQNGDGYLNPTAAIEILKNFPYFQQNTKELCQKHSFMKKQIYTQQMRGFKQTHILPNSIQQMSAVIKQGLTSKKFHKKEQKNQEKTQNDLALKLENQIAQRDISIFIVKSIGFVLLGPILGSLMLLTLVFSR